jgi:hypothetical protein
MPSHISNLLIILGIAFAMRCFRSLPLFWIVVWPGTAVHEILHWIVGKLLGAKPVHFSLIPKHKENETILGSVTFSNITWWNGLPIGMAPLFAIPACIWLISHLNFVYNWKGAALIWVLSSTLCQCSPSPQDRSIAFCSGWGIALWVSIAYLIVREDHSLHPYALSLEHETLQWVKWVGSLTKRIIRTGQVFDGFTL